MQKPKNSGVQSGVGTAGIETKKLRELMHQEKIFYEEQATPMNAFYHFVDALQHTLSFGMVLFTWFPVLLLPTQHWLVYGGGWVFVFVLIPVFDLLFGKDGKNPTINQQKHMETVWLYKVFLFVYPPIQTVYLLWAMTHWTRYSSTMPLASKIMFIASLGTTTGALGVNLSHELFHKINSKLKRYLGLFLLYQASYIHFSLAHMSHHRKVGTVRDPATAKYGESLYHFLPRSWFMGFFEAWDAEKHRLAAHKKSMFSLDNQLPWLFAGQLWTWLFVYMIFGQSGLFFFLAQSAVSQFLIETVNYVEHYGLQRKIGEPVNILHSWNANDRFSNWVFFKLERHSDHHANPLKSYQNLCSYSMSPTLVSGYPTMVLMAMVPPLWFKFMNPLCEKINAVDIKDLEEQMIKERHAQKQPALVVRGIKHAWNVTNAVAQEVLGEETHGRVVELARDAHRKTHEKITTIAQDVIVKGSTIAQDVIIHTKTVYESGSQIFRLTNTTKNKLD